MRKLKYLILVFIMALCVLPVTGCKDEPTRIQLVDKIKYGVVAVSDMTTIGSGVIVMAERSGCTIITNYHVVSNAPYYNSKPEIRFFDEEGWIKADILGYSADYDIAVLKTEYVPKQVYVFSIGQNPAIGEDILSAGYSAGLQFSVYDGMVSSSSKFARIYSVYSSDYLYITETTAPAPEGTSGGACFDYSGALVGLNAFRYTDYSDALSGISYKIPISIVKAVFDRVNSATTHPFSIAAGFTINSDGHINVTCLGELFTVSVLSDGLKIISSKNTSYPVDKIITAVNGKKADAITFISELLATRENIKMTFKA